MSKKIFIAEDDDGIREVYECAFLGAGYAIECFITAEELFAKLKLSTPDLIILDIMLPQMDGITALTALKAEHSVYKNIPVLLISARNEENIKVKGLTIGADDYITKPFGVFELIARIKNILKRTEVQQPSDDVAELCKFGEITVDDKKRRISIGDNKIDTTPKEFNIIKILVAKQGEVVTRDELLDRVWGDTFFGETRTLDIHINGIRQKIAQYTDVKYIKTVRGVGYIISEEE